MAIDTEDKRRSAVNMPLFTVMPTADGTIDAEDREQATGYYSGITPAAPEVIERRRRGLLLGVY